MDNFGRHEVGTWRRVDPDLAGGAESRVMTQLASLGGYTVGHVPRELNKDADRLSNVAIDELRA